jgi:hypothetical protein
MTGERSPWAANRRRGRAVRVARGSSRLWSVLQLIFSLWLLYALAVVGISITVPGEEGAIASNLALLPPAHLIRSALFLGLGAFAVLSALRSLGNLLAEYRRESRIQVPAARDFIASLAHSDEEYALILRPMDTDANLFLPVARPLRDRLRDPGAATATLEEIVAGEVEKLLGMRTIAVVDPRRDEVAPGADYVAVDEDWQIELEALVSRAWCVFVLVPPSGDEGADLRWELAEIFRKGLIGRAAVVLPPRLLKHPAQVEGLTAAMIPHATDAERAVLADYLLGDVILAHLSEEPEFWADAPSRFGPFVRSTGRAYAQAIAECLHDIEAAMPPRAERYPYFHTARKQLAPRLAIVPPPARTAND